MGLFPKHLQYIAYLMNELCPSIVHAVQTDFARARSFPWRSQCSSSLRSIHSTPGWLYRFSTTPDAMVVRDSPRNQDFTVIDSGHVTANLSRYSPVPGPCYGVFFENDLSQKLCFLCLMVIFLGALRNPDESWLEFCSPGPKMACSSLVLRCSALFCACSACTRTSVPATPG